MTLWLTTKFWQMITMQGYCVIKSMHKYIHCKSCMTIYGHDHISKWRIVWEKTSSKMVVLPHYAAKCVAREGGGRWWLDNWPPVPYPCLWWWWRWLDYWPPGLCTCLWWWWWWWCPPGLWLNYFFILMMKSFHWKRRMHCKVHCNWYHHALTYHLPWPSGSCHPTLFINGFPILMDFQMMIKVIQTPQLWGIRIIRCNL